ncbi:MAG: tRNA-splicing ligase [Planctomycetes bacterium SM23_32]|nr:MAG: tRNA-splicing ligase [Planctomycetes bacterium SM23_32]
MAERGYELKQVGPLVWEIPATGRMNVPVRIYADSQLLESIERDNAVQQSINVAYMPGIVRASFAMPDAHWGYGFPIGGVAAFDPGQDGVVSPGGIGFDINCGVRLIRTDLTEQEVRPRIQELVNQLYSQVPCGVGSSKAIRRLGEKELRQLCVEGAGWAVENGFGVPDDLERTEAHGALQGADPDALSQKALKRGQPQVGTLGSGNHFLEVDRVAEVFDEAAAEAFGVARGQVVLQVHCGSRGFGHQVCSDYLKTMQNATRKYGIDVPDRQLACAPLGSPEADRYLAAMACAANYAWANRQTILTLAARAFEGVFGGDRDALGFRQVYDVCHNIAKFEEHDVDGERRTLCVHRKGATRAFPPGHAETPTPYRHVGQPVLIPGDMGTASYLLVGTERAMQETWGSTCHGAGRLMSRKGAIRKASGRSIKRELAERGITVRCEGRTTLAEEMPEAYKNVDAVVTVMHEAGITRKVARLEPIGVVKG